MREVVDGFWIWDLGLVVQIYDLVVSDLVLVLGFVLGFSSSALWPLDFDSTRIDYPYLWFRIWLLLLGFFHLSLFVLGVWVDGGKRIGLLLVLLRMDWWVCVCILAGFVFVFLLDLSTFVFVFLLDLCLCSYLILCLFSKKKKMRKFQIKENFLLVLKSGFVFWLFLLKALFNLNSRDFLFLILLFS